MRIEVAYSSGLVELYRTEGESGLTSNALAGAPDRQRGETSAAVLLRLRLDRLEQDGLRVDMYWYGTTVDDLTGRTATGDFGADEVPELCLELGRVWRILDAGEMGGVTSIDIDGRRRVERVGGKLVNLDRLVDLQRYLVGRQGGESLVDQVVAAHEAIRRGHPSWDDARVAAEYGFPVEAYRSVKAAWSRRGGAEAGESLRDRLVGFLRDNPDAGVGEAIDALGVTADAIRPLWAAAKSEAGVEDKRALRPDESGSEGLADLSSLFPCPPGVK